MFGAPGHSEQFQDLAQGKPAPPGHVTGTLTEAAAARTSTRPLRHSLAYGSPRRLAELLDSARHGLVG